MAPAQGWQANSWSVPYFLKNKKLKKKKNEKYHKEKSNGIRKRSIFILTQLILKSFSEFEYNKMLTLSILLIERLNIISDTY